MIPSNAVRELLRTKGIEWNAENDEFYGFFYDNTVENLVHVSGKYYVDFENGLEQLRFALKAEEGDLPIEFTDYLTLDGLLDSLENQANNGYPMVHIKTDDKPVAFNIMITGIVEVDAVAMLKEYHNELGQVENAKETVGELLMEYLSNALVEAQVNQCFEYIQMDTSFVQTQ